MDLFSSRSRALTPRTEGPDQPVPEDPRQAAVQADDLAAAASRRRRTPGAPRPKHAAPSPGRPARPSPPPRSGWPPGKRKRHSGKCRPCPRCTSRWPGSPPSAPGVHRRCWTMRPSARAARIAVAEVQQHHAVWSMAQLRFEVHRALPVLPPGTDGEALVTEVAGWPSRPGRDRSHPGHRPRPHRRDQPGGPGLRRGQHLPAAERGTVLHPGPPRHRRADPHRRQTDRAAARQPPSRPVRPPSAPG